MISHRHRCIYVKVPKCASTSVLDWFMTHGGGRPSFRPAWHGGAMSRRLPGTAQAMNLYPDYFTFTFLRDPYERFVSLWLDLRRVARLRRRGAGAEPEGLATPGGFADLCADILADFGPCWGREAADAFREKRDRVYGPGRVRLGDLGWSADHLWPQTAFLPDCNPERLFGVARLDARPLDFIGSVGRMEADFARLGRLLGLPDAPLAHRNASGARDAQACGGYARYYDAATRRAVEALYAADLELTGCGFGDEGAAACRRTWTVARTVVRRPPGAPALAHASGAGVARAVVAGGRHDGAPAAPAGGDARGASAGGPARPRLSAGRAEMAGR